MDKGLVIWLTGLSGSGKSTIGKALYQSLHKQIPNIVYIDGDLLREILGATSYDREGRIDVALKRAKIANFLSNQGIVCVVSTVSMFNEVYAYNRSHIQNYFEIYIECPMQELIARDQKGLYTQALKGEIENVVGVDLDFDKPTPHLCINNHLCNDLDSKVQQILKSLPPLFMPSVSL
ncbi:MAG: adenylyl-sulfate kinase [Helicobacter sp.]|nr:adenylyl-sulfate kinase [Helicobacter sp.]